MQIVVKVQRQPEEESELNLLSMQGPVRTQLVQRHLLHNIQYTILATRLKRVNK